MCSLHCWILDCTILCSREDVIWSLCCWGRNLSSPGFDRAESPPIIFSVLSHYSLEFSSVKLHVCMCVPRSGLILSCIRLYCGVLLPVLLPNLPFLTCLSMSTLESVTYLPEKGLYCQRLPSSRTHGGTESLKGKNPENMGFYGTLKMIFYKVSKLFSSCVVWLCVCVCTPAWEGKSVSSEMAAVSSNFGGWLDVWYSVLYHECKQIMERQRELKKALHLK